MDWAQLLVIILGVFLAIFLLLAILLAVLLLRITKQIRTVATTAEQTVSALRGAASGLGTTPVPLMIVRTVLRQLAKSRSKMKKTNNGVNSKGGRQ